MIPASLPGDEKERIEDLHNYGILDTAYEETFQQIVQLASEICNTPISTITLVDTNRQWFKARLGLEDSETDRNIAFCSHAILHNSLMEIEDATKDERFFDNPLVTGSPFIRFYAGMPLTSAKGYKLGTLCVIDSKPAVLNEHQKFALSILANQAMQLIELHKKHAEVANMAETNKKIISIISHDVRNPLGAIKSIIELRNDDIITDEEANEMLVVASQQIDSTVEMIANIVDWGRMQINARNLKKTDVNVQEVVQHCFDMVKAASTLKNNKLLLYDEVKTVYTDLNALQFILRNLVTNANKFTENGTITVTSKEEAGKTVLSISDDGVGMTQDKVKSLFANPKNYSEPGTRNEPGSGLGLILIKEFLDKINARIHIQSEPGKGTIISIYF